MRNIIKALNYQNCRDYFVIIVLLMCVAVSLFVDGIMLLENTGEPSGGEYLALSGSDMISTTLMFLILFITSRVCGWDYSDKTINYEIMAGHLRSSVYWGRIAVSMIWCMTAGAVVMILPYAVCSLINGWGVNMDLGYAAVRFLLTLFPMFRMVCEFALLTFLVKNCYVSLIAGYLFSGVVMMIQMFGEELFGIDIVYQFAVTNIIWLFRFNYRPGFIDGEDVMIYDASVNALMIIGTIGASLAAGIICLLIGSALFRKRDLN